MRDSGACLEHLQFLKTVQSVSGETIQFHNNISWIQMDFNFPQLYSTTLSMMPASVGQRDRLRIHSTTNNVTDYSSTICI